MSYPKEIIEKIGVKKEILSTLPVNNKKNLAKYQAELEDTLSEFEKIETYIYDEIKLRYSEIHKVEPKDNLSQIQNELNNISSIIYLLNDISSSYEKMELDKRIHKLKFYYMNNLEEINSVILGAILKFKEVGITLTKDDFSYSRYTKEYVSLFLEGVERKKLDLTAIQEKFETIYWKSPDLITHIELNFRYLFLKYKKRIDKYYEDKKKYIISTMKPSIIYNRYNKLVKERDNLSDNDAYKIVHNFLEGKITPLEYLEKNMHANYAKFMSEIFLESILNTPKQDELDLNLIKLKNAAYEYKQIIRFKYVIDDIKKRYEENKDNKGLKAEEAKLLKDITKQEKKIIALTKKTEKSRFNKKIDESLLVQQNLLINATKEMYKEYDKVRINNMIVEKINDASTIEDLLRMASSFYRELFSVTKENFPELSEDEIDDMVKDLKNFISWPYNILTNNTNINENKNLLYVIKDRYSLMNINITEEMLEPDALTTLIEDLSKFENYYYIRKNNINIEKMIDFCNLKSLIERVEKEKKDTDK